jgi:hypothetical protein
MHFPCVSSPSAACLFLQPGQLDAVFRDIWLLLKHIWFRVGTAEIANDAKSRAAEEVRQEELRTL